MCQSTCARLALLARGHPVICGNERELTRNFLPHESLPPYTAPKRIEKLSTITYFKPVHFLMYHLDLYSLFDVSLRFLSTVGIRSVNREVDGVLVVLSLNKLRQRTSFDASL